MINGIDAVDGERINTQLVNRNILLLQNNKLAFANTTFQKSNENFERARSLSPNHIKKRPVENRKSLPSNLNKALPIALLKGDFGQPHNEDLEHAHKNLCLSLELKWGTSAASKQILEFVDELFFLNNFFPSVASIKSMNTVFSQLIYLINYHPKTALEFTSKENISGSIEKIEASFSHSLKRIHKKITEHCKEQMANGYKNAEVAKHIAIPIAISRILMPHTGLMIEGLIPFIIKEFITDHNPYSESLEAGLKLLSNNIMLRNQIESIKISDNPNCPSHMLIYAALNLAEKVELKDTHAKRMALASLLTHLRQGENGSCFASFFAIELQSINPAGAIKDYKELIEEGRLSRTFENALYEFPYLLKADNPEIYERADLRTPGIQAIFKYLSLTLESYAFEWDKEVTANEFIEDLAGKFTCNADFLRMIFNAVTRSPLLSVWENSIAGMAEGLKGSMLKSALVQSVQYIVKKAAKTKGYLHDLNKFDILAKLETSINARSRYMYDPTFAIKDLLKGAFVLYDNKMQAEKIKSGTDFQGFLVSLIEDIWVDVKDPEGHGLKAVLLDEVVQDEMLFMLLKRYHRENENGDLNKKNIQNLRFTPWVTSIGNDPQMVLKVYNQVEPAHQILQISPIHAEELITQIEQMMRSLPLEQKNKYLEHGDYGIPIRIRGVHIFSLLPCHSSMQRFLHEGGTKAPSLYYEQPNSIPSKVRKYLLEFALSFVKEKYRNPLEQKMQSLPRKCSIQKMRALLIEMIMSFSPPFHQVEEIAHQLDIKIVELLPKQTRALWEQSIIHFADTNWQSSIHDIHYGIGINPGTGEVELMSVLENGKIYKFLNQDHFFKGKKWEIFLQPHT